MSAKANWNSLSKLYTMNSSPKLAKVCKNNQNKISTTM